MNIKILDRDLGHFPVTAERVDTDENYGEDKRLTILLVIKLLSLHPKPILYTLRSPAGSL